MLSYASAEPTAALLAVEFQVGAPATQCRLLRVRSAFAKECDEVGADLCCTAYYDQVL